MSDTTDDTKVSEPTEVKDEVDTSTNEETQDTADLETDNTSFDDVEDTDETEDLEAEDTDTAPLELEEESEEDAEQTEESEDVADDTDEPEETEESSDEESTEKDTTSEEDIKRHNQEMAARRIAEKQAREQAKAQQQQQYLEQAEDDKDLALRQLQIDAYNNRVESNVNKLQNGIEKAVANIDLFHNGTPEIKEALASSLEKFERMNVKYDSNGDPIHVEGDVYEYLQNEADTFKRILKTGARQQVKAKTKAKARTETLPTRAPKEPKVDPDLAAFDEEVAKWE